MKEKVETAQLLGNVRVKLRTYGLRSYEPPEELRVEVRLARDDSQYCLSQGGGTDGSRVAQDVAEKWSELLRFESEQARLIEVFMRR